MISAFFVRKTRFIRIFSGCPPVMLDVDAITNKKGTVPSRHKSLFGTGVMFFWDVPAVTVALRCPGTLKSPQSIACLGI